MEIQDNERMELEGSATTAAVMNTSLYFSANITKITLSTYYQHSLYVASGYIIAYFLIFLLCIVGNTLVCLIVAENRRMRTVTNLFILNLAISDLLVGIFCIPTTLVDNLITGWPFSNTVCKMSGFVQGVSVSASVFTLVAIAVERFRVIVYPLQPKPTIFVAKAAILLIWVLAVLIMCPAAVALTVDTVPFHYMVYNDDFNHTFPLYTCYENFTNPRMSKVYTAVLLVLIYLVPLSVITVMYSGISVKLSSSVVANREPQLDNTTGPVGGRRGAPPTISQKKIRVIKMLIVVALLFILSWLPLWTLMMMTDYAGLDRDQLDLLTSYIFPFAHWLAFSNSSVNPIIYGYYNENFKRGFQAVCKSWRRMAGQARNKRTLQAPCGGAAFREAMRNHNQPVLGLRNRVHNDSKLNDIANANANKSARVGSVVVHRERTNGEESIRVSALAPAVYQAWDN